MTTISSRNVDRTHVTLPTTIIYVLTVPALDSAERLSNLRRTCIHCSLGLPNVGTIELSVAQQRGRVLTQHKRLAHEGL